MLANGWKTVKLEFTAEPGVGSFIDGDWIESPHITEEGIRLVQTGNIGLGKFLDRAKHRKFISERSFQELRCKWVYPGDILICRLADPIGRACMIPSEICPCVTAVDCTIYRPNPNEVDRNFAVQLLNSDPHLQKVNDVAGGSTRQRICRGHLGSIEVLLPPLPEQRRIAEILDTADRTIGETEILISKLKLMKTGLMHDLLTRGLDESGQLRDPDVHPEQFKESPLGRIPREWSVAPLEALQSPERPYIKTGPFGSTLKGEHWVEEGVPVITIGALGEGAFLEEELLYINEDKAQSLAAYSVTPGDLVFSRVADVGRSVVVEENERDWIISSNLMRISLDHAKAMPKFAHLNLVHSENTREQVRRSVNAGGREVANTAILRSLRFAWPPIEEQHRITEILDAHDARIRAEEAYRDKLKLQKKGLMEDLLTGRVRVNRAQEVGA